jgi:hypothetical protein
MSNKMSALEAQLLSIASGFVESRKTPRTYRGRIVGIPVLNLVLAHAKGVGRTKKLTQHQSVHLRMLPYHIEA